MLYISHKITPSGDILWPPRVSKKEPSLLDITDWTFSFRRCQSPKEMRAEFLELRRLWNIQCAAQAARRAFLKPTKGEKMKFSVEVKTICDCKPRVYKIEEVFGPTLKELPKAFLKESKEFLSYLFRYDKNIFAKRADGKVIRILSVGDTHTEESLMFLTKLFTRKNDELRKFYSSVAQEMVNQIDQTLEKEEQND